VKTRRRGEPIEWTLRQIAISAVRILERSQFRSIRERSFSSFSSFRGFHTAWVISLGGDRGRGPAYVRSTSDRVEILRTAVKDAKVESRMGAVAWAMRQRSVSHPRSSNRTCRFPASGLYGAFFVKGASRHFCRAFVTPFFCSTRAALLLQLDDVLAHGRA
jgi:hypothetical protein